MTDSKLAKALSEFAIPSEWRLVKLSDLGSTYGGLSGKTKDDFGNGKPYIPYLNIFSNATISDGAFDFVSIGENETQSRVKKGDLFFTTSSETPEEVGMCSVYEGDVEELYLNSFCFGFRPNNPETISSAFIAFLFRSSIGRRLIHKLAQGATRYNISKTSLCKEYFPLPTLSEQKVVVRALRLADQAIDVNNKLIAQKVLRRKWLMQNLLTGKKRLNGFTTKWNEVRIGDLLRKVFRYADWDDDNVYRLVSMRRRYGGLFERGDFFGHQIEVKKIKSLQHNDFLISKRQVSHGAWGMVPATFHDWMVSDEYDCLIVKDATRLNMEFWDWLCKMPQMTHYAFLASNGVHIEKLIFDFNSFKKRKVRLPSLDEQIAIARILKAADREIMLLKTKTEKLREQKKAMMQQLLTGKKRLKIEE